MQTGVLLINLGTPKQPTLKDVALYLYEFLSDRRVIDLPVVIRKILVCSFIIPFRVRQSTKNYRKIWLQEGSPLLVNSQNLTDNLQTILGQNYKVMLAMRYGQPGIKETLHKLLNKPLKELIIIPLFPQYSSAASGSAIEQALSEIKKYTVIPKIKVINHWYQEPSYIQALTHSVKQYYQPGQHLVFSFHGLPLRQNIASCQNSCASFRACYRNQCLQTAQQVATMLGLEPKSWSLAFQSRLGRIEWLKPYLEEHLRKLYMDGVRQVCIISPGFVADCLETLEELGMQLKKLWFELGGTSYTLIPCLNATGSKVLASLIHNNNS